MVGGTGNGLRNLASGNDITTKVYPSDVIPDKKVLEHQRQRGVFRLNNFLNDPYVTKQLGLSNQPGMSLGGTQFQAQEQVGIQYGSSNLDELDDKDGEEELEVELTEEEFHYAVKMTEVSIRQLTK